MDTLKWWSVTFGGALAILAATGLLICLVVSL